MAQVIKEDGSIDKEDLATKLRALKESYKKEYRNASYGGNESDLELRKAIAWAKEDLITDLMNIFDVEVW